MVGRFFGVGWESWEAEREDDKVVDCCGDGFLLCWRHFGGLNRLWIGSYGRCRKAGILIYSRYSFWNLSLLESLASALGSELHRYVIGVSRRHAFRLLTSTSNQTTTEILSNTAFCYLRSSFQTAGYHSIYQDHCRDLQDTPYHHDPRQGPRRQGICR
jgi:hypothetical protein